MSLLDIFKSKPKPHVHNFTEFVMKTGNENSVSTNNGVKYFGPSWIRKCECGKWGVLHTGATEYVVLDNP